MNLITFTAACVGEILRSQLNRDVFWQLLRPHNGFKMKTAILAAGSLYTGHENTTQNNV